MINIVIPIVFLSLINPVVFLLPHESGEGVAFPVTILLSFTVFPECCWRQRTENVITDAAVVSLRSDCPSYQRSYHCLEYSVSETLPYSRAGASSKMVKGVFTHVVWGDKK